MHANTVGLKVVLADGTILDLMTENSINSKEYDMKHLFIGSEGTLVRIFNIQINSYFRVLLPNVKLCANLCLKIDRFVC
jgi:D-2-hydroxyglutarate dehydrogenase